MRAFFTLLLAAVATAELAPLVENIEPVPGQYIIKLKDSMNVDQMADTVRVSGGTITSIYRHVINAFAADLSPHVLDIVRRLPGVEYVEQNGVVRAQAETRLGDDYSWGIDRIDSRDLVLDKAYTPHISEGGDGATVWVIDTGVRESHEQFTDGKGGKLSRAKLAANTIDNKDEDCNGHGTHCCGTVGGFSLGVANKVTIKAVKTMNCIGSGTTKSVMDGIEFVRIRAGSKDVASMSLGGGIAPSLDSAVAALIASGVPTAVAAGNNNKDACNYSPARCTTAVTVGSTNSKDNKSSFSNHGSCVDIFAPGSNIKSAGRLSDTATATMSGTSMACPHVAGAIALYTSTTSRQAEKDMIKAVTRGCINDLDRQSPNCLLYV